jgi:hypothetical protein
MKILKKTLLVLVVLALLGAIVGLFFPSKFTLERSLVINADQKIIFDQINILKNWKAWSPWMKMDPEATIIYSGPESGVGASYSWSGKETGEGTLTISESIPYQSVSFDMDFKENGKAISGYKIEKAEGGNKLTQWFETESGNNPYKKLMSAIMGKWYLTSKFDEGMNAIKSITESMPATTADPEPVAPAVADTIPADTTK